MVSGDVMWVLYLLTYGIAFLMLWAVVVVFLCLGVIAIRVRWAIHEHKQALKEQKEDGSTIR